jgi:hypothetical protein
VSCRRALILVNYNEDDNVATFERRRFHHEVEVVLAAKDGVEHDDADGPTWESGDALPLLWLADVLTR